MYFMPDGIQSLLGWPRTYGKPAERRTAEQPILFEISGLLCRETHAMTCSATRESIKKRRIIVLETIGMCIAPKKGKPFFPEGGT
jgi:hypothetical protein